MSELFAEERQELEAAGWEPRGEGAKTIWCRPEGGRWYAHYQALAILREETFNDRLDSKGGPTTLGGGGAA